MTGCVPLNAIYSVKNSPGSGLSTGCCSSGPEFDSRPWWNLFNHKPGSMLLNLSLSPSHHRNMNRRKIASHIQLLTAGFESNIISTVSKRLTFCTTEAHLLICVCILIIARKTQHYLSNKSRLDKTSFFTWIKLSNSRCMPNAPNFLMTYCICHF